MHNGARRLNHSSHQRPHLAGTCNFPLLFREGIKIAGFLRVERLRRSAGRESGHTDVIQQRV